MTPILSPFPKRFALSLALSCLVAAGCTLPQQPWAGGAITRLRDLSVEPAILVQPGTQTSLKVSLAAGLSTQALSFSWTRAVITLSNPTLLASALSRDLNQAGGTSINASTANFIGLRPGAGYSLDVTLYDGATVVASGTNANITLLAGANTVSVSLTTTAASPTPAPSPLGYTMQTVISPGGLMQPFGVTTDAAGNVYVSSSANCRIYMVSEGIVTPIAGNGDSAFNGDGQLATNAQLGYPTQLAVDSEGNIYVADDSHHRIRKFTVGGLISTFVGTGVDAEGANGTPAASCTLYGPLAIGVDRDDNVYFSSDFGKIVRMVPKTDGTYFGISMTAGCVYTIAEGFGQVTDLFITPSGNLILSDPYNSLIHMIPKTDGIYYGISMTANHLYDLPFAFNYAMGIAGDASGNLFVAESSSNRIRKIAPDGTDTVVVGTGEWGFPDEGEPATSAKLDFPSDVAVDSSGNLFITDMGNHALLKAVVQY